ncbi:MAG: hypothetical protein OXE02_04585 [Chloroflexi bacterium]|nr:hypothetical protein [Chloroflexota bacterium]
MRLRPADSRTRGRWRSTHADAGPHCHAHLHADGDPHGNSDSDRYPYPDLHPDANSYRNPDSITDTNAYTDSHSHPNAYTRPVPVDRVPTGVVARRRADCPRRVRGNPGIRDVRVGAPQQARRRRRGRAVRGLDDRPRDRRHPADRCRLPRVGGLRLVDAHARSYPDTYVYPYTNADPTSYSCELPSIGAAHDAQQWLGSHLRIAA